MSPTDTHSSVLSRNDTLTRMSISGANVLPTPGSKLISPELPRIYNPGVKGLAVAHGEFFIGPNGQVDALDFAQHAVGGIPKSDVLIVEDGTMCALGDSLVTLASNIASRGYDLAVFPMRAGHRLRQILEGMLELHPSFASIEFSEAASKPHDDFFRDLLMQAIRTHNHENAQLRLAVVDVGDSGEGTKKMLQLLREIRERYYRKQNWRVDCHIFHHHGESWNFFQYQRPRGPFAVLIEPYRTYTGTWLLDDWAAAMGMAKVPPKDTGGYRERTRGQRADMPGRSGHQISRWFRSTRFPRRKACCESRDQPLLY